jgi:hypothetical protein
MSGRVGPFSHIAMKIQIHTWEPGPLVSMNILDFNGQTMISIVYGSLVSGLPNNRAAVVGGHGRHLRPIFANWLYQLPNLPALLFTCQAKVAII